MVRYPLPRQKTDNKNAKAGDANGQPCVAEITCQVCKLNTHLGDSCEFLYTPCSRKDCSGIRIIKTSNTLKNTGRKFLKCQYNCPNFQWLEDAVEEQISGKKTNKNKYSTTSRGQTPRLVGSNQGQRPRGMRDRIRMKVNLDEVSGKFSILMIIKGLFRRYERWNPVHPTSGAFWGMGIGIGCGVGWGPGFGPDVVGYVGAGCGIGFSVGITLAGIGIGLPANFLIEFPYNAFRATGTSALGFAGGGWNVLGPQISGFQKETKRRMSNFNQKHSLGQGVDLTEMKRRLTFHAKSLMESSQAITNRDSQSRNGTQPS